MMHTVTEQTDPFSFGLGIPPYYWTASSGLGPFSGNNGAVHAAAYSDPFSFGLGIAPPPPDGFGLFPGGAAIGADNASLCDDRPLYGPFRPGGDTYTYTGPFSHDSYARTVGGALPAAAGFTPTPVYGNPFDAVGGATDPAMECPLAPWELYCYDGHAQPPVVEPVSSSRQVPAPAAPFRDRVVLKDSSSSPTESQPYGYDDEMEADIEATLRAQEKDARQRPSPQYLETTQGGRVSSETRAYLVRWMNQLTRRYDLAPGTLHRAVSYADRFLSARPLADVATRRLQLLSAAAVYAAAKYEDMDTVNKVDAKEIARHGRFGSSEEVLGMELALLKALDFRLGGPTAHTFVDHFTRRYSQQDEVDQVLRSRAHGFADVSLLHYGCLHLRPSAVAAAAMFLARLTLKPSYVDMKCWNRKLKEVTGYEPKDLQRGVDAIRSLVPDHGFDKVVIFPMFYAIADSD
ncbi:hypothetical protein BS78_04G190400 [Paspalum vaginatum]|nr:hypothetical protein BS78_04G190400 [Paspalum vaginatum]